MVDTLLAVPAGTVAELTSQCGVNVPSFPESLFHTDTTPGQLLCILRLQVYTGIMLLLLFLPGKPEAAG